jgi:hypothetical protein
MVGFLLIFGFETTGLTTDVVGVFIVVGVVGVFVVTIGALGTLGLGVPVVGFVVVGVWVFDVNVVLGT